MSASELRASARTALKGNWVKGALIVLVYLLIMWGISFVLGLIPFVGQIASIVISVPISYGLAVSFIRLKRGEGISYVSFLQDGFASFGKVWGVYGHTILKMIVPIILIIISSFVFSFSIAGTITSGVFTENSSATVGFSGLSIIALICYIASLVYAIVKGYLYSLTNYILYDNPNMTSKEIVLQSESLMRGNRGKYVLLSLSFIGWAILSVFTFYIGLLWLVPYISVATVCFYETLSGKGSKEEIVVEPKNDNPISE